MRREEVGDVAANGVAQDGRDVAWARARVIRVGEGWAGGAADGGRAGREGGGSGEAGRGGVVLGEAVPLCAHAGTGGTGGWAGPLRAVADLVRRRGCTAAGAVASSSGASSEEEVVGEGKLSLENTAPSVRRRSLFVVAMVLLGV